MFACLFFLFHFFFRLSSDNSVTNGETISLVNQNKSLLVPQTENNLHTTAIDPTNIAELNETTQTTTKTQHETVQIPSNDTCQPPNVASTSDDKQNGKAMRQVVAAFIANLGTVNTGLVFGFSAVVIPQLQQPDSIIQIDENQKSWIGKTHITFKLKEFAYRN